MILRTITSALRKIGAMVHRAVATKMDGNSNKERDDASGKQSWILLLLSRICTDKASVGVVLCVIGIVALNGGDDVTASDNVAPMSIITLQNSISTAFMNIEMEWETTTLGNVNYDFTMKSKIWLDHGKFRTHEECVTDIPEPYKIQTKEVAYNGKCLYGGTPGLGYREMPAVLVIRDPHMNSDEYYASTCLQYLRYIGVHVPNDYYYMDEFPYFGASVMYYYNHGESVSISDMNGIIVFKCHVPDYALLNKREEDIEKIRKQFTGTPMSSNRIEAMINEIEQAKLKTPKKYIEMHLSPDYGYGVVKYIEKTVDNTMIAETHSEQWNHYENHDIWIPGYIRCEYGYASDIPTRTNILSVCPKTPLFFRATAVDPHDTLSKLRLE